MGGSRHSSNSVFSMFTGWSIPQFGDSIPSIILQAEMHLRVEVHFCLELMTGFAFLKPLQLLVYSL